jgi:hypothetical protein
MTGIYNRNMTEVEAIRSVLEAEEQYKNEIKKSFKQEKKTGLFTFFKHKQPKEDIPDTDLKNSPKKGF